MTKDFVHLHVHSEYSLLDGLSKIKGLISYVKELGMKSVAVTDHGVMYGAIEFYKKAKAEEIKPIIGMEAYVVKEDHIAKNDRTKSKNYHLLLLAKDLEGYKNLMKLTSIAHLEGYYYRPRIDRTTLAKYSKGLICTSACPLSEVGQALIAEDYKEATEVVSWHKDVFGKDYYLEIQRHNYERFVDKAPSEVKSNLREMIETEKKMTDGIVKLSRDFSIPIIATNDAHYIRKDDAVAQDALVCVSTGKNVSDTKRLRFIDSPDFYIKNQDEMYEAFVDMPEVCSNTVKVADECNFEITLGQWFFPKVDLPQGKSDVEFFKELIEKGLKEKYKEITTEIRDRADYEMQVIIDKGYAAYFLIYWDMSNWAIERRIPINTRGSVAGSIVSFVLGITTVDPIAYNLPFERFLNPLRPSAPDIDMDISDDKRQEMINYLTQKYGVEKVAQICTFGRMLARGSVRDIARVLGYPYETGDRISKMIPLGAQGFPMTIDRALKETPDLDALYKTDPDAKRILDLSRRIEGNARHLSVHAAGIVIAPTEITNFTPIQKEKESTGDKIITQYEMHACEDVGLVKLDILGIRNLAILRGAVELTKIIKGIDIDLLKIPVDDKKTFAMLSRGETMGTFQLSGSGMTRYVVELAPERIEDIMAMIALYRPGPIANIPDYIARKKGNQKVKYYHPKMERFLDKSYGILVYQDDLLYTALELAGYDWLEVDKFRKAVGKKIPEEMALQHIKFVDGCIAHSGMTKDEAEGLWKLFEPFQGYGFNKAHAASYGMVAYQTSYMKANYPVEFMTSLLTAESSDKEKVSAAVNECKRLGIDVLPPDINESKTNFTIVDKEGSFEGKAIRFGLGAIKNVGGAAITAITDERREKSFISFSDFISRVDGRKVNKKVVESLIKVGAFDRFGARSSLLGSLDAVRNKLAKLASNASQQGLFTEEENDTTLVDDSALIIKMDEYESEKLEEFERELLGYSLSAKPIGEVLGSFMNFASHKIKDIADNTASRKEVKVAAVVSEMRVVVTKKSGREMAFGRVSDDTGAIDVVIFPSIYEQTKTAWEGQTPLLISGKLDAREEGTSLIVESIKTSVDFSDSDERLFIEVAEGTGSDQLKDLKNLFIANPGDQKVSLLFTGAGKKRVDLGFGINWNKEISEKINFILNSHLDS